MELKEILEGIKKRWTISGHSEYVNGIDRAPMGASTGSEGLILICQYVRVLKSENIIVYNEIEDLAEQLFDYEKKDLETRNTN